MQTLESGFIHFAAMGNHMYRNEMPVRIGRIQHAPATHAELEQIRKGTCQRLRLDLMVMLGEPLDLFGNALAIGVSSRERSSTACGVNWT